MDKQQFIKPLVWSTPSGEPITAKLKPDQRHVDYNLILTAHKDDFIHILPALDDLHPVLVDRIALEDLAATDLWEQLTTLHVYRDIEIRLYALTKGEEANEEFLWSVIHRVSETASQAKKIVFADPNFVTGDPGPGSGGGGSGGIGGGPGGPVGERTTQEAFIKNWTFKPFHGIFLEDGDGRRLTEYTGQGTHAYIFDSVDRQLEFGLSEPEGDAAYQTLRGPIVLRRGLHKELEVFLSSPSARFNQNVSARVVQLQSPDELHDVDEHGVYVTGLVHRVAPDCTLHLVDVLNRRGQGELFGLLRALFLIAKRGAEAFSNEALTPMSNVVLNLSLGVKYAENTARLTRVPESLRALRKTIHETGISNFNPILFRILEDMVVDFQYVGSLRLLIKILAEFGAVMIAAAGNDSATEPGSLRSQIPGRYPEVISVAASTSWGEKANFSNLGDLMAPGGGKASPDQENEHLPKMQMTLAELEEAGVISIVPKTEPSDTGFAYWQGTSFSAPLVAGAVALMLEKILRNGDASESGAMMIKDLLMQHARDDVLNVLTAVAAIPHK